MKENWKEITFLLILILAGILFVYAGLTTMFDAGSTADASPPLSLERLESSIGWFFGIIAGSVGTVMTAVGIAVLIQTLKKNC